MFSRLLAAGFFLVASLSGCSRSPPVMCTIEVLGKEPFRFELPESVTNYYRVDTTAYDSFRSTLSWGQLWILEPKDTKDAMLFLGNEGRFKIETG